MQQQQEMTGQQQDLQRQSLQRKYNDCVQLVFHGIFADVRLKSVVEQIQSSPGDLKLQYLQTSVSKLLSNYQYEQNILQLGQ